jgi:hypothetical protein
MRRDSTIAKLAPRDLLSMADVVEYAERRGVELYDLLAYSANADGPSGRLRLVAIFPGRPSTVHPDVLCLDGPRESDHRNPPFEDGVFGKSAVLCLYFRRDPQERRWTPENGLLGLFDLARVHLVNEHEWRRWRKWPGDEAPHGETPPARANPSLALPPISPRNTVLDYVRSELRALAVREAA